MTEYIMGVDVSHWQGNRIDWKKCASAGAKFAIIKITEGNSYFDSYFARNWEEAQAAGLKVGAYHMVSFDVSPESQVAWLMSNLSKFSTGHFPVALDCELGGSGNKVATVWKMASELQDVMIYTAMNWWNTNIKPLTSGKNWNKFPLWVANYTSASAPVIPDGWDDWSIWQYSQNGDAQMYGVNQFDAKYIDLDRMKKAFWAKYIDQKPKRKRHKKKLTQKWRY